MEKTTRRGDTLLEVVLAFTIFSLVMTIAVVSMNAGLLRLEGALELSLARTEIDAQAEALRFVHNSYVRNPDDTEGTYYQLWTAITNQANTSMTSIPDFQPSSCQTLYEDTDRSIYTAHAFILNPRNLHPRIGNDSATWTDSLISANLDDKIFTTATLYPRLIFTIPATDDAEETTTDDVLRETGDFSELARAEGIYVTEVRDPGKTFWDFYIYTCFVEAGANRPTTIGTTVRLYDPDF